MTPYPQLTLQPNIAAHLTEDQFGELLTDSSQAASSPAQAHLLSCDQCAAELFTLRDSLSLFRHAASAYADNELRRLPQISLPSRSIVSTALGPTQWVAATAIFLVALLPMQIARQHSLRSAPAVSASVSSDLDQSQSDEALLEDVDRDTSALIPEPMQTLADPTANFSTSTDTSIQSSVQRKD
jgi:hypothetical protein